MRLNVCFSAGAYNIDNAILTLIHSMQSVHVDVSLLINDLRFSKGEWLNIIGYLENISSKWIVKAIMAWPVSPGFNLTHYENTVKLRMQSTV